MSSSVLRKKIRMRAILKESTANYISLESLINVEFRKNMNCQFVLISQKKIATMPGLALGLELGTRARDSPFLSFFFKFFRVRISF